MSGDESCSGYVNWDTFTVGSTLANEEPLYLQSKRVVREARDAYRDPEDFTASLAGVALQAVFGDKAIYDAPTLDMAKVDWQDVAESVLDDVNEQWPIEEEEDPAEVDQRLPDPGEHGYVDQLDYPHNQPPER